MPKEPEVILYTSPHKVLIKGPGGKRPISASTLEFEVIQGLSGMTAAQVAEEYGISTEEAFELLTTSDPGELVKFTRSDGLVVCL